MTTYTRSEAVSALMVAGYPAMARRVHALEPAAVVRLRIGRKRAVAEAVTLRGILWERIEDAKEARL